MFVFANFLNAVAAVLDVVLTAYYWIIIVRALLSWVNPDPWNPIVQFLQPGHRTRFGPDPSPVADLAHGHRPLAAGGDPGRHVRPVLPGGLP